MKYLIITLMMVVGILQSFGQQKWKLAKSEKGIKVYVGEVPNSDYYAFKATMTVKTTENEILNILKNVSKYSEWFAYTASTQLIKQTENEQYFIMETDYPWPFSNECKKFAMIYKNIENNKTVISITGLNEKINCSYSLKKASGYILLEQENENIKITYYFHSEPMQSIPSKLINPMIYRMPFQTFMALKKRLKN